MAIRLNTGEVNMVIWAEQLPQVIPNSTVAIPTKYDLSLAIHTIFGLRETTSGLNGITAEISEPFDGSEWRSINIPDESTHLTLTELDAGSVTMARLSLSYDSTGGTTDPLTTIDPLTTVFSATTIINPCWKITALLVMLVLSFVY